MYTKYEETNSSKEKLSSVLLTMLSENIDVTITVTGDSMFPLWRHKRDTVVLTNCDKSALRKGVIPLYVRESGQYVMHRIVKANNNNYNLCGDAQTQIEYNLPKEKIVAVVKGFTRKGKEYSCDDLWVRIYSVLWMWLFPFRGIILKAYRKLSRYEY
jgi:signal peptidase